MASTHCYKTIERNNHNYLPSANYHKPVTDTCYNKHYEHFDQSRSMHHEQYSQQYSQHGQKTHHEPPAHNKLNPNYNHNMQHGHHKEHEAMELLLSCGGYGGHTKDSEYRSSCAAHGSLGTIHEKKKTHGIKCITVNDEYERKEIRGKKKRSKEGRFSYDSSSGSDSD